MCNCRQRRLLDRSRRSQQRGGRVPNLLRHAAKPERSYVLSSIQQPHAATSTIAITSPHSLVTVTLTVTLTSGSGGWTVVLRVGDNLDDNNHEFFEVYTKGAVLRTKGDAAAPHATFTRPMPRERFDTIGIGCYDSHMKPIDGTFRTQSASTWKYTGFITAEDTSWYSKNIACQYNTFGYQNGYSSLLWNHASDWRELNLVDFSLPNRCNTHMLGYIVWKNQPTGGPYTGRSNRQCNGHPVSKNNQLVVLVRQA